VHEHRVARAALLRAAAGRPRRVAEDDGDGALSRCDGRGVECVALYELAVSPESPEDLAGAVEGGCVQIAPLDGSWVASRASGGLEHRCEEDAGTYGRVDDTDARVAEPCPHTEALTQGAVGLAHDERRQRGRRVDDARRT